MKTKQFSFVFFLIVAFLPALSHSNDFVKECMPGISLEDLESHYVQQLENIKKTDAWKKKNIREKELERAHAEYVIAQNRCNWHQKGSLVSWQLWCTEQDCIEAKNLKEKLRASQGAYFYASKKHHEAHPEFIKLQECILEKKYNELHIPQG